jgi:hypothetical protein
MREYHVRICDARRAAGNEPQSEVRHRTKRTAAGRGQHVFLTRRVTRQKWLFDTGRRGRENDDLLGSDDRQLAADAMVTKVLVRGEAVTAPATSTMDQERF